MLGSPPALNAAADRKCICVADGSKSDSDDDNAPVFNTYSSSSAFDKLSQSKKGIFLGSAPGGAVVQSCQVFFLCFLLCSDSETLRCSSQTQENPSSKSKETG